ncbi:MAG: YajQ family cyclic di-GMP-binding protein [Gammaproteobacteria bacterium]|nr:YajQ family cyclic di-GMP-binding protein [Gammaproteobacteria bacterium]
MPSFDIVSEVDAHELSNAIDQMNREITNRFDFKGSNARVELKDSAMNIEAENEFQLKQIEEIMYNKLAKRSIDTRCLDKSKIEERGRRAYQTITVRQGVDADMSRKIVKLIKEKKLKVQAAVQGDQVRVTGKKRDDLQEVMAMLKANEQIDLPLQFTNFRD